MRDLQVQAPDGHNVRVLAYGDGGLAVELDGCEVPELEFADLDVLPGSYAELRCPSCGALAAVTVEEAA